MSAWREKARELFPEMRPQIDSAESAGTFWVELASRFKGSYAPSPDVDRRDSAKLIRNVCMYAIWCTRSDSADVQQAAWIEFYEGVPKYAFQCESSLYERIIQDLVANLGIEEIEKSSGTMIGYLKREQRRKFLEDVEKAEHKRQRRSGKRTK